MSATLNNEKEEKEWNFRVTAQRLIIVKTKNSNVRKVAALDVLTNLSIALSVPTNILIESLQTEKEYLAHFNVFTSKNLEGVDKDFIGFFDALDIDQGVEDFIKAYWVYPGKMRFELLEVEEP